MFDLVPCLAAVGRPSRLAHRGGWLLQRDSLSAPQPLACYTKAARPFLFLRTMAADQQQLSLKAKVAKRHDFFGDNSEDAFARSDTMGILLTKQHAGTRLSLRERLFLILADPSTSRAAAIFGIVQWVVILLRCAANVSQRAVL